MSLFKFSGKQLAEEIKKKITNEKYVSCKIIG